MFLGLLGSRPRSLLPACKNEWLGRNSSNKRITLMGHKYEKCVARCTFELLLPAKFWLVTNHKFHKRLKDREPKRVLKTSV